jgi:hypothetical protein
VSMTTSRSGNWAQRFAPILNQRLRANSGCGSDVRSLAGQWMYPYRACGFRWRHDHCGQAVPAFCIIGKWRGPARQYEVSGFSVELELQGRSDDETACRLE